MPLKDKGHENKLIKKKIMIAECAAGLVWVGYMLFSMS